MKRTYNEKGDLIAYEVTKEMRNRGRRMYYREQLKDISKRVAIVAVFFALMGTLFIIGTN